MQVTGRTVEYRPMFDPGDAGSAPKRLDPADVAPQNTIKIFFKER